MFFLGEELMGLDQIVLERIAREAAVSLKQAAATIDLLDSQGTIPFIARYRKEATGNLDEVQILTISERLQYYRELLERRATILKTIEDQGKLTEELKAKILARYEKHELEDLYLPFKPKRKTRASVAIEKGLEPLARFIYEQVPGDKTIEELAESCVNPEIEVGSKELAIEGALHIVAEWLSEDGEIRKCIREQILKEGVVVSRVNKDKANEKTKYENYYEFREPVSKIPSHRMLAIRRGVKEQVLSFTIEVAPEKALQLISARVIKDPQSVFASHLEKATKDAYERLLNPNLQSEIRAFLRERSDAEAIKVFEANLANLLLTPPAGLIGVMGIDPGFRTGCKVAVVDQTGKFLEQTTIYPTDPQKDIGGFERKLFRLIQRHHVRAIAIGNGTGSREAETFTRAFLKKYGEGESFGSVTSKTQKTEELSPMPSQEVETPLKIEESVAFDAKPEPANLLRNGTALLETQPESEISHPTSMPHSEPAIPTVETVTPSSDVTGLTSEVIVTDPEALRNEEVPSPDQEVVREFRPATTPESGEIPEERHAIFSVIVNEAGASVYSASDSARKEFPKLDVTIRGAISIARRLQDPLAELVKIHPKSIGVGQYQHDVDQKRLKAGLEASVESSVNRVGIDLNTASYELLRYCSGVNQRLAKEIVEYRNQHGQFHNRSEILKVPGFGEKTFEQAAGFLRIKGGDNPLDATAVHPESYPLVERMAQSLNLSVAELIENTQVVESLELKEFADDKVGLYTLTDIKQELLKPGRDPRDQFVVPTFREDVKQVSDLKIDMVLEGTVTNVTNFGAFVDVGVHQDGLVHVSELSNRFVQDPREAVHVGEVVKVKVVAVDVPMKRISLSIKALLPKQKVPKQVHRPVKRTKPLGVRKPAGALEVDKSSTQPVASAISTEIKERKAFSAQRRERKAMPRPEALLKPKNEARPPQVQVKKPVPMKKPEIPDHTLLSFADKIRLLQEKFSGIR